MAICPKKAHKALKIQAIGICNQQALKDSSLARPKDSMRSCSMQVQIALSAANTQMREHSLYSKCLARASGSTCIAGIYHGSFHCALHLLSGQLGAQHPDQMLAGDASRLTVVSDAIKHLARRRQPHLPVAQDISLQQPATLCTGSSLAWHTPCHSMLAQGHLAGRLSSSLARPPAHAAPNSPQKQPAGAPG